VRCEAPPEAMPGEGNISTDVLPVVSPRLSPKKGNVRLTSDQLTDHQRQFGVEIFRGIDVDYSGMIDEEELGAVIHSGASVKAEQLEVGFQEAIQVEMDKMDPGKYKQGFDVYKERGMWKTKPLKADLRDGMADGSLDLMEWLRFLRKAKTEKVQVTRQLYPLFTEEQAIFVADSAVNHWFLSMQERIQNNKIEKRKQMVKREEALKEAQRTPQPSPRLSPSMMAGPNALSANQTKRAAALFKRIDADKSGHLSRDEVLVLFTPERAKEVMQELDSDNDGGVGLDEWHRFLRTHKRTIYTNAITDSPQDEEGAIQKSDEGIDAFFEEMKEGLKSDAAKKMRIDIMHRNQEMDEDSKKLANPLGGLELAPSRAISKMRAEEFQAKHRIVNTRFTPDKKLVYRPNAAKQYSERGSDFYGSQANWSHSSRRNIAEAIAEDTEAKILQKQSSNNRAMYRAAAHKVYNDTTHMLEERVKDSTNANTKIEAAMQGTEGYVRGLEAAREAVATMFELDAEALEEISFCKQKRASRPVAERIKDQVSLSLKRRTEELDIESHESMLKQIDDTQKALWRAREYLSQQLGSKVVAADIDGEAAGLKPETDPAPPVEREMVEANVTDSSNVWAKPWDKCKRLPKSEKGKFAVFQKYAKAYPLRGTGLPSAPTFAEILENNSYIDQTEFGNFVLDYGFSQMLDQNQIAEIFQRNARGTDGQAGSLHFEEFEEVVKEVQKMHEAEKKDWGAEKTPAPTPFRPARKTALTMDQVLFESHVKERLPKQAHLHDKVYIPVHQPIMWKKEVRELCDSVKGHQTEADRVCKKALKFVDKRKFDDELGRKRILAALHKKQNATMDLVAKLQKQKDVACADHEQDVEEKHEVEERIMAVEEYLSIAIVRLQDRTKRPDSERGRDPAEWALDEEVRELRWELHQLGNTHKKLENNIDKLEKLILSLDRDISDKTTAMNLDQECVEKVQRRLLEVGEEQVEEEVQAVEAAEDEEEEEGIGVFND